MELVLCKEKTPPEDFSIFRFFFYEGGSNHSSSAPFATGEFQNVTKGLDYKHNLGALLSKYMYITLIIKVINIFWSSPWHKMVC